MIRAERARQAIDAAHERDSHRLPDGRAAELVYADRVEAWVRRLVPDAGDLLRLAARCQHLERFAVPRTSFPDGRAGYLAWRKSLYEKQAARCAELLRGAGFSEGEARQAARWVAKEGLKRDAGTQALEDAACLVFLENEIAAFAAQHADYPRDKFVEILRKTWRKMSPEAHAFARGLALPPGVADLVKDAAAERA
jgi:tRNAThr (cytosine32-N3)-methyltransferase